MAHRSGLLPFLLTTILCTAAPAIAADSPPAEPLQIAVAANFSACLDEILAAWTGQGGAPAVVAVGSTGRHYAQITNGAPFDLFFAADAERPRLLEERGLAVAGSRFTYALGRLVLWAPKLATEGEDPLLLLAGRRYEHLAIANPRLAPYGRATRQVLEGLGVWDELERGDSARLVMGQSVGQAWQFVAAGAAQAGLLAFSQTIGLENRAGVLPIPETAYDPIEQQAVLLARGRDHPAARAFLEFVRGPVAAPILAEYGYRAPGGEAP